MTDHAPSTQKIVRLKPVQALLLGTLTVGVADILDAILFFGFLGVTPVQILQSIAGGIFGRAAFSGGLPMAALGLLLHFFIAFVIVSAYFFGSQRLPALRRYPLWYGMLYGLLVYLVMTFIVVPLSAAPVGPPSLPVVINGLLIHVFGVGIPSSLFARATWSRATSGDKTK